MGKLKNYFRTLRNRFKFPFKISFLYFIISFFWILLSDRLNRIIFKDEDTLLMVSTVKGWVYVIVITIILYFLLNKALNRVEAAESRLSRNAYYDVVTGLPNRLNLQEKLTHIIQTSSDKVALLYIDLDNFKNINDSFGHFFGDAVLVETGKRLTDTVDDNSFVARLGGDEFAVIIAHVEGTDQVNEFAGKLLLNLITNFKEQDINIHLSASIGIAIYPDHATDFEELLKSADTAMYEAKKKGKMQYALFDSSMNSKLFRKMEMEGNLRNAIENNELVLYYQPLFCVKTQKICGFEALLRWNSPIYGMVLPSIFIPMAEETGLISQIGNWVLGTACRFISSINNAREDKLSISVNVSVHQLAQDNWVDIMTSIMNENHMDTKLITLEITESILMEDVETNLNKISSLKQTGIKLALDDFGTGYSSLTYLKKLPISILKLDKAFIDDMAENQTDSNIVKSIIMLANILNLTVVAEGVESKEQLECLESFGCHMIQGYYISRPIPEEQVLQLFE